MGFHKPWSIHKDIFVNALRMYSQRGVAFGKKANQPLEKTVPVGVEYPKAHVLGGCSVLVGTGLVTKQYGVCDRRNRLGDALAGVDREERQLSASWDSHL